MQIVIIGAGKLGYKLAEAFSNEENSIIVVDIDEQALDRVDANLDVLTIKGNGVQIEVLKEINMKRTDLVIAVTSSDETNMVIGSVVKRLGCKQIVARVRNPEYARQLDFLKTEMNIDFMVNPELETAKDIAKYLLKGLAIHIESFAQGKIGMIDLPVKNIPQIIGRKLKDIELFQSILVAAVSREGNIIVPHGETMLEDMDTIYLFGKRESLDSFAKQYANVGERKHIKTAMILGGGKAGYYLAGRLQQNGVEVKIIERDQQRCNYLAEHLKNVLIIHGDGTDSDLLREENFSDMDAFVSVTGNDEENLLLALLGKQQGIKQVVAKISRSNFIPIIEQIGIDRAVNPVMISASEIIRFVQGGQIASISLLLDGQAEVVEIIVAAESSISGRKLAELNLPKGIIVGAIAHDNKVIIPDGSAVIQPNDRVVLFCLKTEVPTLERLFYRQKGGLIRELWDSYKGSRKHT